MLTKGGRAIECDAVVVGAGVRPDAMLAQRAGLEVGDGIVCDSKLQTSAEGIYAAGDCCSYESVVHGRRLRVEHWDVAMQQGMHAARNMLGDERDYDVVPYFFSDLADWASLEYVGPAHDWDEEVWRGDRDAGEFSVWYLKDGRVAGCLSVGRPEDLAEARRLLADRVDVSAASDDRRRRQRPRRAERPQRRAGYPRACLAAWCNGSTPRSGRGSRGSSPWAAVTRRQRPPREASSRFATFAANEEALVLLWGACAGRLAVAGCGGGGGGRIDRGRAARRPRPRRSARKS